MICDTCPHHLTTCPQVKPWLWWVSNSIVLGGSLLYARVRQLEMAANSAKVHQAKVEENTDTTAANKAKVQT